MCSAARAEGVLPLLPEHVQEPQHAGAAAVGGGGPRRVHAHRGQDSLQVRHTDGESTSLHSLSCLYRWLIVSVSK